MRRSLPPVAVATLLALTACGGDEQALREELRAVVEGEEDSVSAVVPVDVDTELVDPEGSTVGRAVFEDDEHGVRVEIEVAGLSEGFHGVLLSEVGVCEAGGRAPADPAFAGPFLSAGGPLVELPPLLVLDNGVGALATLVGPAALSLDELLDGDGTALVVLEAVDAATAPAGPDEVAPPPGPTGSRVACGAIGG